MNVLGIDIGGTGIKGSLINIKTGELTGDDALTLQDLIERRKQRRISRFAGGGTGQAGAILTGSTTGIGSANA